MSDQFTSRVGDSTLIKGLIMVDFLINTPSHKRWMLPDNIHAFNSVIYGDDIKVSVIELDTMRAKESVIFKLSNPEWQNLCDMFQKLAERKYCKRLRHKSNMARDEAFARGHVMRHQKGFY